MYKFTLFTFINVVYTIHDCIGRRKPVFLSPFKLQHAVFTYARVSERANRMNGWISPCMLSHLSLFLCLALCREIRKFNIISSMGEWKQTQTRVRAGFLIHTHIQFVHVPLAFNRTWKQKNFFGNTKLKNTLYKIIIKCIHNTKNPSTN